MFNSRFEEGKRYISYAFRGEPEKMTLECVKRINEHEVLMKWTDSNNHVVINDASFYSYIEVK